MTVRSNDSLQEIIYTKAVQTIVEPLGFSFDSFECLTDGVTLPKLTEHLVGEKIPGWKEKVNKFQIAPNIQAVLNYLAKKDRMFSMSFDLNAKKDRLGFLWLLLSKFYIKKTKKELMNIFAYILKDYESQIPIRNMTKCWANGLPFIALACKISNGSIKYTDNGAGNYDYIKSACEQLKIPFILTQESIMCEAPDENCVCLQAYMFLEHMGELDLPANLGAAPKPAPAAAPKPTPAAAPKPAANAGSLDRLKMRTDEFISAANLAMEAINKESQAIDNAWINRSVEGVKLLGVAISNFNKTGLKNIKDLVAKARPIWETVGRLANSNKVPVPDVPIDYPSLSQKVTDLENRIKDLKNNLENDTKIMQEWQDKIANVTKLEEAKKIFDEIPYNKDNWKQLPTKSIMYLAGAKIEQIEKHIEDSKRKDIERFERNLNRFHEDLESFKNSMALDKSNPEGTIKKIESSQSQVNDFREDISFIYDYYDGAKASNPDYSAEKPNLNPLLEAVVSELESTKARARALIADNYFAKVEEKYKWKQDSIQEFREVRNVYDKAEIDKRRADAENDGLLVLAVKKHAELVAEAVGAEVEHSAEESAALLAEYRKEMAAVLEELAPQLTAVSEAPIAAYKAKVASGNLGSGELDEATKQCFEAKAAVDAALALKTWPDDATGPVVAQFNSDIKHAQKALEKEFERLRGQLKSVLVHLDFAVKGVEAADIETDSPTIDVAGYEKGRKEAAALIKEADSAIRNQDVLQVSGHDPAAVRARLVAADAALAKRMEEAPARILAKMEGVRGEIAAASEKLADLIERVPVECARIVEEVEVLDELAEDDFYSENEDDNDQKDDQAETENETQNKERKRRHKRNVISPTCTIEEAREKCAEVMKAYAHLRDLRESIERVNTVFSMNVEVPDISDLAAKAGDIDILARSTLFFQPEPRAIQLVDELPELEHPYGVLAAAILAVRRFEKRPCLVPVIGDFESASMTISAIFDTLSEDFINTTSGRALEMMDSNITRAQVEDIEVLIDALAECTPDAAAYVCKVQPHFRSRADLEAKAKALEINQKYTQNKILIEAIALYKRIIDERRNGWVPGDPVIIIDAGTFTTRAGILDIAMVPKYVQSYSFDNEDFKNQLEIALSRRQKDLNPYWNRVDQILYHFMRTRAPVLVVCREAERSIETIAKNVLQKYNNITGVAVASAGAGIVLTSSKRTGVAVDIGNVGVTVTPVIDGRAIEEAVRTGSLGGDELAMKFQSRIADHGMDITRKKRKMAITHSIENSFKVRNPDDTRIDTTVIVPEIGFNADCPDMCFLPERLFEGSESLQELIRQAVYGALEVQEVDPSELYTNVVVAGGLAQVKGLVKRLQRELEEIFEGAQVRAEGNLDLVPYKGACRMAMEPYFDMSIITRSSMPSEWLED